MSDPAPFFARALRKVPGIVVGVLQDGRCEVTALGSVAGQPDPALHFGPSFTYQPVNPSA